MNTMLNGNVVAFKRTAEKSEFPLLDLVPLFGCLDGYNRDWFWRAVDICRLVNNGLFWSEAMWGRHLCDEADTINPFWAKHHYDLCDMTYEQMHNRRDVNLLKAVRAAVALNSEVKKVTGTVFIKRFLKKQDPFDRYSFRLSDAIDLAEELSKGFFACYGWTLDDINWSDNGAVERFFIGKRAA